MKETPLFTPRQGIEELVRYLYLEPLLPGRNVLLVAADAADASRAFLERLGARTVERVRPPERPPLPSDVAAIGGRVDAARDGRRELPFRDAAFDVAFVPEIADLPDPGFLFQDLRRVIGPAGLALVATRNAASLCPISVPPAGGHAEVWTYSRILALLQTFFPAVRMVGQGPFLGYTFVEYQPRGGADVRLDTTLLEGRGEDPEFFLAVCAGERAADLPLPALFQVPLQEFTVAEASGDARGDDDAPGEDRALAAIAAEERLAEVQRRAESLRSELSERNVMIARLEQELRRAQEAAAEAREKATRAARALDEDRREDQRKAIEATFARAAQRVEPPPERPAIDPAELTRLRDQVAAARAEAEAERRAAAEARRAAQEADRRLESARAALREAEAARDELERERETAAERAAAAGRELAAAKATLETERRAAAARTDLENRFTAAGKARDEARAAAADAEARRDRAEQRAREAESKAADAIAAREIAERARAGAEAEAIRQVDAVERRLQEQGRRIADMEKALADRETLVVDLLRDLRHAPFQSSVPVVPDPPPPEATAEPAAVRPAAEARPWIEPGDSAGLPGDRAARQAAIARLEGELTGARWRNAELETAFSEMMEETQAVEAERERLQAALEIAQMAAEELTRDAARTNRERQELQRALDACATERAALEREAAALRPVAAAAAEAGPLIERLRARADELESLLAAREAPPRDGGEPK